MRKTISVLILFAVFWGKAMGDLTIAYTDEYGDFQQYIKDGKMATLQENISMIMDYHAESLTSIHHGLKIYFQASIADYEKAITEYTASVKARMIEVVAAEQGISQSEAQAMIERMIQGGMSQESNLSVRIEKGKSHTEAGFSLQQYKIYLGDKLTRELWVSPDLKKAVEKELGAGKLDKIESKMNDIMADARKNSLGITVPDQIEAEVNKLRQRGIIIIDHDYIDVIGDLLNPAANIVNTLTISRDKILKDHFIVPGHYTKLSPYEYMLREEIWTNDTFDETNE
ncbi:MAG TPA: hypothetical protein ENN84_06475 [Candidatus Marinimicrobia bacterium]|nr:hypothetical protein [Candidatus Neomarinimicrobiota bacterium]